jgi:hypothetical protein
VGGSVNAVNGLIKPIFMLWCLALYRLHIMQGIAYAAFYLFRTRMPVVVPHYRIVTLRHCFNPFCYSFLVPKAN